MVKDYTFYRIVNINGDVDMCYVGSSSDIKQRKRLHKSDCYNIKKKIYNSKLYRTMRDNGGFDEFKFIEIGYKDGITKNEACIIEEEYRLKLRANLNSCKCILTEAERETYSKDWYNKNKERIKENNNKNKEAISKKKSLYYQANKDKIKQYNINRYHDLKQRRLLEQEDGYKAAEIFN